MLTGNEMHICNKPYGNKDHTCFDVHMQKSHHGTDFCLSGSVWLGLGAILMRRMAKVNAVKQSQEEK